MSVIVNANILSEPDREKVFLHGFKQAKILQARVNSQKSHADTQSIKTDIIADYKTNKALYSSKDAAALAYIKQYPLKFSTIRKYLKNL